MDNKPELPNDTQCFYIKRIVDGMEKHLAEICDKYGMEGVLNVLSGVNYHVILTSYDNLLGMIAFCNKLNYETLLLLVAAVSDKTNESN